MLDRFLEVFWPSWLRQLQVSFLQREVSVGFDTGLIGLLLPDFA